MRRGPSDFLYPVSMVLALLCILAPGAATEQKKNKEEVTQTLEVPRDLPNAVTADPRRFTFHVTPLTAKGLLSQQIRDSLKALDRQAGGDTVLQIRAFVAGSGDLRRVRDLVSEVFTDRRKPLPVLTLVRSGGLGLEGAQVVLESIAAARKEVNPHGVAFIAPRPATGGGPMESVVPLTERSLASLRRAVKAAGSEPADVLRVTCFLSSLENLSESRRLVAAEYPRAALNFVQTQRAPFEGLAACEGVSRLRTAPGAVLELRNVEAKPAEPGVSDLARVAGAAAVLTGMQVSFGYQEQDARLAFDRLRKVLDQSGANVQDVAYARYYPLSSGIATQVRKIRAEVFDGALPPASSLLLFEGLASQDSGFAVDVIAIKR